MTAVIRHPEFTPLVTTKLKPPQYHRKMVQRAVRVDQLMNPNWKVLLVLSPAGFGKTVVLSQLADSFSGDVVWYSLDPHDNEPQTFVKHLAYALKQSSLDEMDLRRLLTQPLISEHSHTTAIFLSHILESAPRAGLIIVDNFQTITHPVIYQIIAELIPLLPDHTQLVISGRNPLELIHELALERLHLAGQVQILDRGSLKFTPEELESFYLLHDSSVEKNQFELVAEITGGWPIMVDCLTKREVDLCAAQQRLPEVLTSYLDREVFHGVPEEILEFLSKIAVFSEFTTADCDQLLGTSSSKDRIRYLKSHQLFLENDDEHYYLAPLIRLYLLSRLGPERDLLFKKAGTIAIGKGSLNQAINCFLEAGDRQTLADVLVRFGGEAVVHGRWQDVAEWLGTAVTEGEIRTNPRLSLLQALVEIGRGQLGHAQRAVMQAETLFQQSNDLVAMAECQLLKARIYRGRGAMRESFRFLFDAEANLSESRFKLLLTIEKSVILYSAGKLKDARDVLLQCLEEYEGTGDNEAVVMILEALGNVTYLLGEPSRAIAIFKRAISLAPDGIMPGYNFQDVLSAIYDDWGETEQALVVAQRSLAVKEKIGLTEDLPSSYLQLACICTNLGRFAEAEEYFLKGINYVREHDSDRSTLALNLVFLARTLSLQEKWIEARAYAKEALAVAESQPYLLRTSIPTVAGPILARTGTWDLGMELLKKAEKRAEAMGFVKAHAYNCQAQAALYFMQGDHENAKFYTEKALSLSVKINDLQNFVTCYHWYYPLLLHGLETGTETSFVQLVLRKVGTRCLGHLIPLVLVGSPETKQRIIPVLAEIGGSEAANVLYTLRSDPSRLVRTIAAEAWERLVRPEDAPKTSDTRRSLRLHLLGPVRIFVGDQDITGVKWRSHRARDLLIYLAHIGQPVGKDQIIDALWPEDYHDIEKANAKFHTTVYRLRAVLKKYGFPHMIKHGTEVYSLAGPVTTDLADFDVLMRAAQKRTVDPVEETRLLEEALSHYHGDYLEYLDYDWAIPQREALRLRYSEAKLRLINCYLASEQYEKAIRELVLLLQDDELNETYHSLLIMAYAKSGQRQAAQKQYLRLTAVLRDELGVTPSKETQRLYHELDLGLRA